MSTVNTEGKLNWYLGIELSLRSLGAYLQLGLSLSAVQLRRACVPYHLAVYHATCLWRRKVSHTSEDGLLFLEGVEDEAATPQGQRTTMTRPVSSQVGGTIDAHAFLAEVLAKFDALAAITHGEAADVKLLTRMIKQDLLVKEHRAVQKTAGVTMRDQNPQQQHASEENVVFRMSESDATYANLIGAGHPVAITYRDFVNLTTVLSEVIAWDLLWIHEALDRDENVQHTNPTPTTSASMSAHRIEADCIAVMLPNSVEYNAIWMAAARSGPLHTFLDVLYRNSNHIIGSGDRGGTYRPCRAALMNTNLTNNAMLCHAIECSGSVILIIDAAYVPLLFCACKSAKGAEEREEQHAQKNGASLRLHVPSHVKRIYTWRSHDGHIGAPLHPQMTSEMERLLNEFNAVAYGATKAAGAPQKTRDGRQTSLDEHSTKEATTPPPPTPPLDLFESVKSFYTQAQSCPSFTVEEMRYTYLISSPKARPLVQRILARPPPGWKSLLALKLNTMSSSLRKKKTTSAPQTTAADSVQSRTQLEHYKVKMAAILSELLRRFHHTQPVLFIYTSGTTGLPKAARFSHLRFFATGFLSRVLYYRERIAETVVEQYEEVRYVSTHPDAVKLCALSAANNNHTSTAVVTGVTPTLSPTGVADEQNTGSNNSTGSGHNNSSGDSGRCPSIPQIFGANVLDTSRRKRTTVEATVAIVCNLVLWWVKYFASFVGLEYYVSQAAERWWYSPAQLAAIEEERRIITIYNCLPMYHTVGSVFCLGHLLHAMEEQQYAWAQICRCAPTTAHLAATVPTVRMVLRSKFSASQFRRDLQRYHVTVVQYIGEVLRYAVLYERNHAPTTALSIVPDGSLSSACEAAATLPPTVTEAIALADMSRTTWRVPYAFGNGLREDIWLECMRRLNIAHPVEFYSSTEGNIFLLNLYGMPGVVGHIPRFPAPIAWLSMQYFPLFPFRVLKFDEETQQVYRDPKSGYCAHCAVGDVGEVVGEVIEGFDLFALRRFDGYHKASAKAKDTESSQDQEEDTAARKSKVIRHVLWPYRNDCYFLSGDLIRMDSYGFCRFVDRVGETYRWKGENVSTLEVSNALNSIHTTRIGVQEAVVYGVQLPGREGRAGIAMLRLQPNHMSSPCSRTNISNNHNCCSCDSPTTSRKASPSPPPSSLSSQAVSLAEERRFLQDDLYAFLTGQKTHYADGTASQAALPPYAIPLFIRMQDPLPTEEDGGKQEEEKKSSHTTATTTMPDGTPSTSSTKPFSTAEVVKPPTSATPIEATEDSLQTTTFKYKRGVLIKQGYDFAGSSTVCPDIPQQAWGSETDSHVQDGVDETAVSTPYTRVYVLVTNPAIYKMLSLPPESKAGEVDENTAKTSKAGYVPLTAASRKLLGENLDKCGW